MEETLILPWVQDKDNHNNWFVPFPTNQNQARPLVMIQFVPSEPFTQNKWHATILNLYIVPIEGSIWDVDKVKAAVEDIYIDTVSSLNLFIEASSVRA